MKACEKLKNGIKPPHSKARSALKNIGVHSWLAF